VRSHFGNLILYSAIVAIFFAVLTRREPREQLRFGGLVFLGMAGGVLVLAYLMLPFPR
jgi:multisubunit Na+/H+ antiporter MnhB subunit